MKARFCLALVLLAVMYLPAAHVQAEQSALADGKDVFFGLDFFRTEEDLRNSEVRDIDLSHIESDTVDYADSFVGYYDILDIPCFVSVDLPKFAVGATHITLMLTMTLDEAAVKCEQLVHEGADKWGAKYDGYYIDAGFNIVDREVGGESKTGDMRYSCDWNAGSNGTLSLLFIPGPDKMTVYIFIKG